MLFTTGDSGEKITIEVTWNDYLTIVLFKVQNTERKNKDFFNWHNLGGSSVGSVIPWLGFGGLFLVPSTLSHSTKLSYLTYEMWIVPYSK